MVNREMAGDEQGSGWRYYIYIYANYKKYYLILLTKQKGFS